MSWENSRTKVTATAAALAVVLLTGACSPAISDDPEAGQLLATPATTTKPSSQTRSDSDLDQAATDQRISGDPTRLVGNLAVEVIDQIDHRTTSYVQGLEFSNGRLLESQGRRGLSARSWINAETGEVEAFVALEDDTLFGEGITLVEGQFIQLTWQAGRALTGDGASLADRGPDFTYAGEGWGLCYDGKRLIRSDGSNTLTFHNPIDFAELGSIDIVDANGVPQVNLNELECVGSQVLANVWGSEQILVIDAFTGNLDAVIDASSLRPADTPFDLDHALNGIAYDSETDTYFLTGKLWPTIFRVRIVDGD